MKLFIYDHCPYCVKARMIFGFKKIPVEEVVLLNDDEDTPKKMIGKKMVPILQKEDGSYMSESLDIISYIDNYHNTPILDSDTVNMDLSSWLVEVKDIIYALCMPRWIKAPLAEFASDTAIRYFINKKEAYIGNFTEHMQNSKVYMVKITEELTKLAQILHSENSVNKILSLDDIHLFAVLRGLSIVKGIEYPDIVNSYRYNMAKKSNVPLYEDISI